MNARKTLIALVPLGLLLVAPGSALAANSAVAGGVVRDAGGGLARSGTAYLYADPSASGAASGALPLVARAPIRNGRFRLGAPDTVMPPNPPDAAGYRDWLVTVRTPHGTAASPLSSRDGDPAQVRLRASAAPAQAHVAIRDTCHYSLSKQVDRRVRMSDVHGWIGIDSTFTYAAEHSADTYVGAAVESPKGIWKAQGTDHVTNTKVFGQTATLRGRGNRRVTGVFKFNILKLRGSGCPRNTLKGFTRAYRFEGGMRIEDKHPARRGLSGHCDKAPGHRKLYPSTTVFTSTAQSFTYDRSFTLFWVTLGSSTTFSKNAQITLGNHGSKPAWVCGLSTSGRPVPINDAAMLYAGPRTRH